MSSVLREVVRPATLSLPATSTSSSTSCRVRESFVPSPEDRLPGSLLAAPRGDADQGGSAEEFVPTNHNVGQLQVVQQNLSHAHEHFRPFHTAVVAPYRHLNISK